MRLPKYSTRGALAFDMTPMIDCVFQLIIFFLLASHLAQQETQLEVDLPKATSGQRTEEDDNVRRVVVNVLPEEAAESRIMVSGKRMSTAELTRLIGYETQKANRHLEVRIRSYRKIPFGQIEPILLACARAGVWRVTFAVVEEK
ncbi:MAG: biopolymer transporter ExbD [Thermoguttaceae bacterium]|jgi:biopolymer transport protein ExbD